MRFEEILSRDIFINLEPFILFKQKQGQYYSDNLQKDQVSTQTKQMRLILSPGP